jgi:DNA mismatch endonuclease (patch repair protein)
MSAPKPSSSAVTAVMRGNRADSSVERALRSGLHQRGLRFRKHLAPLRGVRCRPDVVFTRARVAVFVDGCFWHQCSAHFRPSTHNAEWWSAKLRRNVERDREHDRALIDAGWIVVRVWEHENVEAAADRVRDVVRARSAHASSDRTGRVPAV